MSNINDFTALFNDKRKAATVPHVPLDKFQFRLLEIDAYHKWITTGELKADGKPKWALDPDLVLDDTGTKVRCVMGLQLIDGTGLATSGSAPFIDDKHYFTADQVKALKQCIGYVIALRGARIELRDKANATKNGFSRIETQFRFEFDDIAWQIPGN